MAVPGDPGADMQDYCICLRFLYDAENLTETDPDVDGHAGVGRDAAAATSLEPLRPRADRGRAYSRITFGASHPCKAFRVSTTSGALRTTRS